MKKIIVAFVTTVAFLGLSVTAESNPTGIVAQVTSISEAEVAEAGGWCYPPRVSKSGGWYTYSVLGSGNGWHRVAVYKSGTWRYGPYVYGSTTSSIRLYHGSRQGLAICQVL